MNDLEEKMVALAQDFRERADGLRSTESHGPDPALDMVIWKIMADIWDKAASDIDKTIINFNRRKPK